MKNYSLVLLVILGFISSILTSCGAVASRQLPSNSKAITEFSINSSSGVINGNRITVNMPYGTVVTDLVARFKYAGVSIKVRDLEQKSGVTVNNFTNPVTYTVYAADGSKRSYVVTVTIASKTAKAITAFSLNGINSTPISQPVGNNPGRILVTIPYGTNVTNLIATFSTTGTYVFVGNNDQFSGSTPNDFTNPVTYTVYAADGSKQDYIVTVISSSKTSKTITFFSLDGINSAPILQPVEGSPGRISVTVPKNTNVTGLVATFNITGADVFVGKNKQFSGVTPNNFTNPVTYTVYAADGSKQDYIVTVTIASNTAKAITQFSLNGNSGTIIQPSANDSGRISVTVRYGTNVTDLVATFSTTGTYVFVGNTDQFSGVTPNNFTNPVTYTVYAVDGSKQDYIVTVTVASKDAKAITQFSLNGNNGTIIQPSLNNPGRILVTVPRDTDLTNLIATFNATGTYVFVGNIDQFSGITPNNFNNLVTYTVYAADGSKQDYIVKVTMTPNNAKAITAFSLNGNNGTIVQPSGNNPGRISVIVPYGTDLTNLIATFNTTGAFVFVGESVQFSGATPNNFTNPVTYKVYATDGSEQDYVVTVTVAPNTAKAITQFSLNGNSGTIVQPRDNNPGHISVTVPFGTSLTNLIATFNTTGIYVFVESVDQFSGTTPNDFTNPVTYKVYAADGSKQDYVVKVTVAPNTAKAITQFSLNGNSGTIIQPNTNNSGRISVTVPYGTNLTGLIAMFNTTGIYVFVESVDQFSGVTSNNFTNPVTYTVYAADGTKQDYIVTVTVAPNNAKAITAFSLNGSSGKIVQPFGDTPGQISVTVSYGTDLTNLIATFDTTGVYVFVESTDQFSGSTPNDFTNQVTYEVYAADGSKQDYVVTVTVAPNDAKAITAFSLNGNSGTIVQPSGNNPGKISVTVRYGTNVTDLVATFSTTGEYVFVESADQFSGTTPNDFTNPLTYTVYAADGSKQDYIVTVIVAPNTAKAITAFSLNGIDAESIVQPSGGNPGQISVKVPFSTNVTDLIATFNTTGAFVFVESIDQFSNVTPNNFTNPVTYIVYAADGSKQDYIVTVTKSLPWLQIGGDFNLTSPVDSNMAVSNNSQTVHMAYSSMTSGSGIQVFSNPFGSNQWNHLPSPDSGAFDNFINLAPTYSGNNPGGLYILFRSNGGQLEVKNYINGSWASYGQPNYNIIAKVLYPVANSVGMVLDKNGKPYVMFGTSWFNPSSTIVVNCNTPSNQCNGGWPAYGGSAGNITSGGASSQSLDIDLDSSALYFGYSDLNAANPANIGKLSVMHLPNANTSWINLGGYQMSKGKASQIKLKVDQVSHNPYVAFLENNSQVSTMHWTGIKWEYFANLLTNVSEPSLTIDKYGNLYLAVYSPDIKGVKIYQYSVISTHWVQLDGAGLVPAINAIPASDASGYNIELIWADDGTNRGRLYLKYLAGTKDAPKFVVYYYIF